METAYDVMVVGAGAAGLNAALVLGRARRRVAVVDSGEPRNAPAAHMHGYLSRDGMPPRDLLAAGRAEVAGYGVELVDDRVEGIEPGFFVRLAGGRVLRSRRILVATGLADDLPDIPGVAERWGKDVMGCPYCHGYEVRDQPIGVLGGQPDSAGYALLVRQWSTDLVFFRHTGELADEDRERMTAVGVRIVERPVTRLVVDGDRLTGIELDDGTVVARTALFLRPPTTPYDELLTKLGCELDPNGRVAVDDTGRTTAFGVWAAGNVVDAGAGVIKAAAAGSVAAAAVNLDLVGEDLDRATDVSR